MAARGRPRNFDRAEALRRAMERFWRCGYEGTSIGDLAEVMGISRPSLYAAFGSKEALFREAVTLYDTVEGEATLRAFAESPTAREAVTAMLHHNADAYADPDKPSGCMIVLAAVTGAPENAEIRRHLTNLRHRGQEDLRQRLERGKTDGDLPDEVNTAALAAYYTTVLQGLAIQARDGASRAVLTEIIVAAMAAWEPLAGGGKGQR